MLGKVADSLSRSTLTTSADHVSACSLCRYLGRVFVRVARVLERKGVHFAMSLFLPAI